MSPQFLLDEHISRKVAVALARHGIDAQAVDGSDLAGSDDLAILRTAIRDHRILVTYNNTDFPSLLGDIVREGTFVPGIVFIDVATIPPSDIGRLTRALERLARRIVSGDVVPSGGIFLTKT